MNDETELKTEIKLQEEEEKPTVASEKNAFKAMIQQEIRNVIKEMLLEDSSFIAPSTSKQARREPEDKIADTLVLKQEPEKEIPLPYQESIDFEPPSIEPEVINSGNPIDEPQPAPAVQPPQDAPPKREGVNEWDEYERQKGMADYVDSEWSHKSFLLSSKFVDKEVLQLHDIVMKELALSNLPDTEIAFIYAVKMDCIEEWLAMGFYELAKQRLVHMLFRLRLMTSVEGLELIAQHGTSAISMSMDRLAPEREGMSEEEENQKKKSMGIRNVLNKLKR